MFVLEGDMIRTIVEEAVALLSIALFVGMIAIWGGRAVGRMVIAPAGGLTFQPTNLCMACTDGRLRWTGRRRTRTIA